MDPSVIAELKEGVRRYVHDRLVPLEETVAETDSIPEEVRREVAELGLFGMSIPEEYGGLGLTMAAESELVMELGWTSPAFRSLIGTNVGIGSQGILIDGTEAQKTTYLPRLASGELIASFCLTEPESGSDAASLRTRAVRDGDSYVLNGTKRFITNSPTAGIFTVMARTDPDASKAGGISAFIVDSDLPGIQIAKPYRKMGQKGAQVADVIFDDVRVPADCIIGGREGQGFKTAMKVLDRGRIHISALCVGVGRRLIDESLRYATERRQFGQPIVDFQLVQAMLADSQTDLLAAEALVRSVAARYDAGESLTMEAAATKYFCSEMVGRIADRAVQVHGGSGYIADYPVERFYRDVRIFRLYEGTSQVLQLVIAREMKRRAG
ncbi:acyl-CoA dehydrogenase family protein [Marinibaculum pumilum]|uniref:Acyl-CoA dehydrogenase family protein n=1 Tax=Marinibaculum pumilum TaxID=1766165 RepID=A0ABV7L946_9PROT